MPIIRLTKWIVAVLKLTALGIVAIICGGVLYLIVLLTISPTFRSDAAYRVGLVELSRSIEPGPDEPSYPNADDLAVVRRDHDAVSNWIQHCAGIKLWAPIPVAELMFPTEQSTGGAYTHFTNSPREPESALIQLSSNVSEERLALLSKIRSSYTLWEITTLIAICIGMTTTILVSIGSTDIARDHPKWQQVIRILSIIFPALGTATTAVIGFYGPQAAWAQQSRTLASETQLHDQIAMGVWNIKCSEVDNGADLTKSLQEWSKRYTDIQTISNASGTPSGSQGTGNPPGAGQGSGTPPDVLPATIKLSGP